MAYLGTQPNDVKKNTGLYTPSEILQLTKDGNWGGSLELIAESNPSGVNIVDFTDIKEYDKGIKIVCCGNCRHEEEEKKPTNPEDLFNGA